MGKIFCLMGKSASGKDTIYRHLLEDPSLGLHKVISYTTRPIRSGEENGREYFFVDDERCQEMDAAGRIIEKRTYQTVFGPWHYFTADDGQIDPEQGHYLLIGTLEAYVKIRDHFGSDRVVPLYIEVEDGLRLERALLRERSQKRPAYDEMCRRFLADCEDFSEEKLEAAGIRCRYDNADLSACLETVKATVRKVF